MPLYFFAFDGDDPLPEAREAHPDDEAALTAASRMASELNRNRGRLTWVTVFNERGQVIGRVGGGVEDCSH